MRLDDDVFRVVTGGAHGMSDLKWFADHLPADGSAQLARPDQRLVHARAVGPARARHPRERHQRRRLPRGLPVRALPHDRGRPAARARLADLLRRRPRLGAVRADRAGRAAVGRSSPRPARRTASSPPGSASTARPAGSRSATAPTASSSTADYNVVEAGMAWGKVKDEDFVGSEAHLRHREEEPAAILCTLTVDDHTSASGRQALHARRRADPDARRRAARRPQGPALVRHERRRRARRSASTS